jgi:hypothetical protein
MNAKEYMEFTDEPSPPALRGLGGLGGKSKPLNKDKVKAPTDPSSGDRGLPKVGLSKKAEPSNPLDNAAPAPAPVFDMSLLSKALQESNKDIVAAIQQLASVVEKSNPDTKYNEHIDDVISNIDDKVLTDDVVIVLSKSKVEEPQVLGLENKQVKMYNSLREMLDNL